MVGNYYHCGVIIQKSKDPTNFVIKILVESWYWILPTIPRISFALGPMMITPERVMQAIRGNFHHHEEIPFFLKQQLLSNPNLLSTML